MQANIYGSVISYDDYGCGPAVVLLQDSTQPSRAWENEAKKLKDEGYRVIVPEFCEDDINSNASDGNMTTRLKSLIGLMNYLGIGRSVMVSLQEGAGILLEALRSYPGRLAGACRIVVSNGAENNEADTSLLSIKAETSEDVSVRLKEFLSQLNTAKRCSSGFRKVA